MSFAGLLNQTITVYGKSSYNQEGREVVGSGTNYLGRFRPTTKTKLLPNGQVQSIDAVCILPSNVSVNINDRVDYSGVAYKVIGKSGAIDGKGDVHHNTYQLVKWKQT